MSLNSFLTQDVIKVADSIMHDTSLLHVGIIHLYGKLLSRYIYTVDFESMEVICLPLKTEEFALVLDDKATY